MIAVEPLTPADEAEWDAYLRARPDGLFYSCSRYRLLLRELLGCREESLTAREGGRIVGVLPVLRADGTHGPVYNSLPYYGSNGGPLAETREVERELLGAWTELTADAAATTLVPNPFARQRLDGLARTHGDVRVAQWTELPADALEPSARRNVRKALRAGITVERDERELPRLAALHRENILALGGGPKDARFFELVRASLEPQRDYDVWIARLEGEVVAGLLVFHWGRTVEYYTPAIAHAHRSLQPLAAILAEALADAARRGAAIWNWGGTWESQASLLRFKRKWGARETRYEYVTRVREPSLLELTADELSEAYPGFYVLPFAALGKEIASPVPL